MAIQFDDLDRFFTQCEKAINPIDYIPFISSISAALRGTIGKLMIVASAILSVGFAIAGLFNKDYRSACSHMFHYTAQGFGNVIRALIASIPFVNLSLIVYDRSTRFTYPTEVVPIRPTHV